jgi:YVTN family beta-propeller protein
VGVNPTTNRIYVANVDSNDVSVIDGATNTEIDTDGNPANGITRIPVGSNVLGVAANPATNRIYVANPLSNNISVIDGATNAVTATATVGSYPYAVTVNPTTNRIYVTNRDDNTVSVIEDLPPAVGGIAELPAVETNAAAGDTGSSAPGPLALAGLAAVGALLLVTGALYAGRRWGR